MLLSNRYQRVDLEGPYSDWLPITPEVPKGSILGPLLFLIFANDLPHYVQTGSTLALFADDSKLYKSLDSSDSTLTSNKIWLGYGNGPPRTV